MSFFRTVASVLIFFACVAVHAANPVDDSEVLRPVMAAYTLGIGSSHISDTYLTPLKYKGIATSLGYERLQAMRFSPEKWVMQLQGSLSLDRDENPARNAAMWDLDFSISWAMMHRRHISSIDGLQLWVGGSTTLDVGALYLARNGNNPVSAKASWTLDLTGAAVYNTQIARLPVTFRYQPTLPVIGAFFSPDYGELYYEIYLGNHSNLAHAAWWGNYFRLNNLLTADLRFGSTNLRVGYRADIISTKVNNIVSRRVDHVFVIGVSGNWLSLPRSGSISSNAKIISALY